MLYSLQCGFSYPIHEKLSLQEDKIGGMTNFYKSEFYSKVYIFTSCSHFFLATFDWIMSVDVHWFSTIFALRNFAMSFYHGTVVITLIIIILNKMGYLPFLNKAHLKDFSKYIFILEHHMDLPVVLSVHADMVCQHP
jgi:riboflavin transporter FmnP